MITYFTVLKIALFNSISLALIAAVIITWLIESKWLVRVLKVLERRII